MRFSAVCRTFFLLLLALLPLTTLVHRDDVGRWEVQRSAMAAPDEFSYLLMAQHFLHGGGLSLQADLGRDTFYPPGYPLLLAGWGRCFGLTAFTAHALNAALLSAGTIVVYFFCRRLLQQLARAGHRRFALSSEAAGNFALLIAGLFATNWHVLETSLLIMSEPAFMLATFAWLALALKWPDWPASPPKTAAIMLLAVAAWSIRGAGIVCVGTTMVHPVLGWLRARLSKRGPESGPTLRRVPLAIVLGIPLAYQVTLALAAPEKSLAHAEDSANSYPRQLLHGLMIHVDAGEPWHAVALAWIRHLSLLIFGHLNDFAASFVPWPRDNPDLHFRDVIGKTFAVLGLAGFLFHALRLAPFRRRQAAPLRAFEVIAPSAPDAKMGRPSLRCYDLPPATDPEGSGFLELFLLLYITLYLIWPFNFERFWSPILPMMLVFAGDAVWRFSESRAWSAPRHAVARLVPTAVLLTLLLVLSGVELCKQLGNYARRLNYVSDAMADGVRKIIRALPDPQRTVVAGLGEDELFALAWYFSQEPNGAGYRIGAPEPHVAAKGGKGEHADEMLIRWANELRPGPAVAGATDTGGRLFFFSYFPNVDTRDTLISFARQMPEDAIGKIFQKEIIASVWEIRLKPRSATSEAAGDTELLARWIQRDGLISPRRE